MSFKIMILALYSFWTAIPGFDQLSPTIDYVIFVCTC